MKKIGITGGMGSGKSTVAAFFRNIFHVPVYDSDTRARALYMEDPKLAEALKEGFGQDLYDSEGNFIKEKLASRVFGNPEALAHLNALVHPAVERDFLRWCDGHRHHPYLIKEAALLFESGTYKNLDLVYTVAAPEEVRIQRAMKRDGSTRTSVLSRMAGQWSEAERLSTAHGVIVNDGNLLLIPQLLELDRSFRDA